MDFIIVHPPFAGFGWMSGGFRILSPDNPGVKPRTRRPFRKYSADLEFSLRRVFFTLDISKKGGSHEAQTRSFHHRRAGLQAYRVRSRTAEIRRAGERAAGRPDPFLVPEGYELADGFQLKGDGKVITKVASGFFRWLGFDRKSPAGKKVP
jgi:hypothetical protein